jgi:hypothetical protein
MAGNKRLTDNNPKARADKLFLGAWCLKKQGRGNYSDLFDEQAERFAGYSDRSVSVTISAANKKIEQDVARAAVPGTVATAPPNEQAFTSPAGTRGGEYFFLTTLRRHHSFCSF